MRGAAVLNIMIAEAFGHRVTLHLRDRDIDTKTPLAKIVEDGDRSFLRCHRSYVVNMDHIRYVQDKSFKMANGVEVPIRTNGMTQVIADYHAYLFKSTREL